MTNMEQKIVEDIFEVELRNKIAQQEKLDYVGKFSPEGLAVAKKQRKFHLINAWEEKMISDKYDDEERNNGFMIENSSFGVPKEYYIDKNGKKISDEFDRIEDFSDGVGLVKNDKKYFFINKEGKQIISETFDFGTSSFRGGMAVICYDNSGPRYLINKSGEKIRPEGFDGASMFLEGLAWTVKDGKQHFFDRKGKEVSPNELAELEFISSPAHASQTTGRELAEEGFEPEATVRFYDGVASLKNKKDGKYYFFNDKYKKIIPDGFDSVDNFTEEHVVFAKLGDDWFLVNKLGRKLATLAAVQPFHNGVAEVYTKNKIGNWFYINKDGQKVFS